MKLSRFLCFMLCYAYALPLRTHCFLSVSLYFYMLLNANIVIQFYEGVLEPIKGIKRLRI